MAEFISVVVIVTSIWVLFDAKTIGVKQGQIDGMGDMGPWRWFFVCLLLWIVGFPFYLSKRSEYKRINGMAGLKKCPNCAEWVQRDASVCRYCKLEFATFAPAPEHPIAQAARLHREEEEARKERKGKQIAVGCLGAIVLALLGLIVFAILVGRS